MSSKENQNNLKNRHKFIIKQPVVTKTLIALCDESPAQFLDRCKKCTKWIAVSSLPGLCRKATRETKMTKSFALFLGSRHRPTIRKTVWTLRTFCTKMKLKDSIINYWNYSPRTMFLLRRNRYSVSEPELCPGHFPTATLEIPAKHTALDKTRWLTIRTITLFSITAVPWILKTRATGSLPSESSGILKIAR